VCRWSPRPTTGHPPHRWPTAPRTAVSGTPTTVTAAVVAVVAVETVVGVRVVFVSRHRGAHGWPAGHGLSIARGTVHGKPAKTISERKSEKECVCVCEGGGERGRERERERERVRQREGVSVREREGGGEIEERDE
jgi:hypothetical protein